MYNVHILYLNMYKGTKKLLVLSTEHNVDDRSMEEFVYLYIAHKVESLYRFFVVVAVQMLHTFTLVYLKCGLSLSACLLQ